MIPELREYYKEELKAEYASGEQNGFMRGEEIGFRRGEETGFRRGEETTLKQSVRKLWKKGMSLSELAEFAETDESTIQSWLDEEDDLKANLS
jgi:flagellar biosynthesis/type III secretory pathway protein FliH